MLKPLLRRYRRPVTGILLVSLVSGFSEALVVAAIVPLTVTITQGVDVFSTTVAGISIEIGLGWLFAIVFALTLLRLGSQTLQSWLIARLVARYEREEQSALYRAFIGADWSAQSVSRGGHLQDLATTYIQRTMVALEHLCKSLAVLANLFAVLLTALVIGPIIALTLGVVSVVIFLAVRPLATASAEVSAKQRVISLELAEQISETVLMAREIRIFDAGKQVQRRMQQLLQRNVKQRRMQRFLIEWATTLFQSLALMVVVGGLLFLWQIDFRNVGSLAAVALLLIRGLAYAQGFQRPYHRFKEARPFFDSLDEQKGTLLAARDEDDGLELDSIDRLRFDAVSYGYPEGEHPALRSVTLEVERGEIIGMVGPSGAGKSTFVQLLMRLRRPSEGAILIGDRRADAYSSSSFYGRIGYVPQEPLLLNDTVEANIRFFRPEASRAEVERAARLAHVHSDIEAFKDGYDTPVGERGGSISGGQRQRISLARALLGEPDVLVLDEPTSALDGRSESLIQETIHDLKGSVLVFIVAHRLSTLTGCDRVMVLEDGRLTAFDPPETLTRSSTYFGAAMRQAQLA